jgi:hypothetical protein
MREVFHEGGEFRFQLFVPMLCALPGEFEDVRGMSGHRRRMIVKRLAGGKQNPLDLQPVHPRARIGLTMTAKDAIDAANAAGLGERLHRYGTICGPCGACQREPLDSDPGRWTWCPDCLTIYDDYGKAVNAIPEFQDYGRAN